MDKKFDRDYLELLAHKWKAGTLSQQEEADYIEWYKSHNDEQLELPENYAANPIAIRELMWFKVKERIKQVQQPKSRTLRLSTTWISIAAASVAVVAWLIWFGYFKDEANHQLVQKTIQPADVLPGINKAILMVGNGKSIALSEAKDGITIGKTGIKYNDGEAVASPVPANNSGQLMKIATPRGGEYQIELPDGTKVWLNAATVLQFSANLLERNERKVELISGEAYFEVKKDKTRPFLVQSGKQLIRVLGTHFNVNNYADEDAVRTTLAEGSVKVGNANYDDVVLRPGQQAINTGTKITIAPADLNTTLAWKDGKLKFENASVQEIMKQVARWYDLEIIYKGKITRDTFTGAINRQSNLATVLRMFEASQINFVVEQGPTGKQLIIKP